MIIGVFVCLAALVAWQRLKAHATAGSGPFRTPPPPVVVDCSALHAGNAADWRIVADGQRREGMVAAAAHSDALADRSDQLARESAR